MDFELVAAVGSSLVALAALALNIESRVNDKPKVQVRFDNHLYSAFADTRSREFVPELIQTVMIVVNSGRRASSILDIQCFVFLGEDDESPYELVNASIAIYKAMKLPLNVSNDTAEQLKVAWLLGKTGRYVEYNHRFSLFVAQEYRERGIGGEPKQSSPHE